MGNRIVISSRQLTILVILNVIGTTILILPSILVKGAKQDAWLSAIVTLIVSLLLLWLYLALHRRYPDKTFIQMFEAVLGKWAGKMITVLFLMLYPFLLGALTLRNVGDFLSTQIMRETPIEVIHIIFMIVVVYAVRLGLEPIVRAGEFLIPIALLMLIIMYISLLPQMKIENLFPILENGVKPVILGAIPFISFPFMENVLFLMILPYVKDQKKVGKSLLYGILIGWVILFVLTLLTIVVLGTDVTSSEIYPSYSLARKISIAKIFERVEITIAVAWFITSFFRVCFYFYCAIDGLSQAFNLSDNRALNIPLAMLFIVLSIIASPNIIFLMHADITILPYFNATFGLALPLVLLMTMAIKKKIGKR